MSAGVGGSIHRCFGPGHLVADKQEIRPKWQFFGVSDMPARASPQPSLRALLPEVFAVPPGGGLIRLFFQSLYGKSRMQLKQLGNSLDV
jgi:hypothetical protein